MNRQPLTSIIRRMSGLSKPPIGLSKLSDFLKVPFAVHGTVTSQKMKDNSFVEPKSVMIFWFPIAGS